VRWPQLRWPQLRWTELRWSWRDLNLAQLRVVAPLLALTVTVGLHLWRRNALLSVFGRTAVNVALVSTLFASSSARQSVQPGGPYGTQHGKRQRVTASNRGPVRA
jgi:hypothetical protein